MSLSSACPASSQFFLLRTSVRRSAATSPTAPSVLLQQRVFDLAARGTACCSTSCSLYSHPPAAARPLSLLRAAAASASACAQQHRRLILAAETPASRLSPLCRLFLLLLLLHQSCPWGSLGTPSRKDILPYAAATSLITRSPCFSSSSRYGACGRSSQPLFRGHYSSVVSSPGIAPAAAAMAFSCNLLQRMLQRVGRPLGCAAALGGGASSSSAAANSAVTLSRGGAAGAPSFRAIAVAPGSQSSSSPIKLSFAQQATSMSFLLGAWRSRRGCCSSSLNSSSCYMRETARTWKHDNVFVPRCSGSSRSFSSCTSVGRSSKTPALLQGKIDEPLHASHSSSKRSASMLSSPLHALHFRSVSPSTSSTASQVLPQHAAAWYGPHSSRAVHFHCSSRSASDSDGAGSSTSEVATSHSSSDASARRVSSSSSSSFSGSSSSSSCPVSGKTAVGSLTASSTAADQDTAAAERRWNSSSNSCAPASSEIRQQQQQGDAWHVNEEIAAAVRSRLPGLIDSAAAAAISAAASAAAAGSRPLKALAEDVKGLYMLERAAKAAECYDGLGEEPAAAAQLEQQQMYEAAAHAPVSIQKLFNSVVKVYSDYTDPNYSLPWQMHRQGTSTGSGFVLRDRLIMTNAHCVSWNNRLQVRKHGSPNKYVARILAVGHECDLALITVDEEDFWKGDMAELEFGEVPSLQDAVVVLGYPRGGDNLCITSGVVSRVDVNPYAHSNTCLLCVQIDAAINPGNSGGPALKEGRVVGVAFQGFDNAQNIGYIVPTSVIQHFLEDVKRHRCYTGFPSAGILFQHLENKSMQAFLGMDRIKQTDLPQGVEASGILVTMADELRPKQYLRALRHHRQMMEQQQQQQGEQQLQQGVQQLQQQTQQTQQTQQQRQGRLQQGEQGKEGQQQGVTEMEGARCGSSSSNNSAAAASSSCTKRAKGSSDSSSSSAGGAAARAVEESSSSSRSEKKKKSLLSPCETKEVPANPQQSEEELRTPEGTLVGLKKNDVILAIDGVDVANDGTVFFRDMERVNVSHTISSKFVGDTITATVLRKKKVLNVLVPLIHENALVPKHQWDMKARYLIYGGLVFCPLTLEYLKDEFGVKFNERAPSSLLQPLTDIFAKEEGEEPVVLSHILASDLTSGYMFRNCLLTHVNGTKVLNMRHLAKVLGLNVPPPIPFESATPLYAGASMLQKPRDAGLPTAAAEVQAAADATDIAAVTAWGTDPSYPVTDAAAAALLRATAADAAVAAKSAQLQQQKEQQTAQQKKDEGQELSDKRQNEFVIFLLEDKVQLVLERAKAESMQPYILKQHAICSPTSDVL